MASQALKAAKIKKTIRAWFYVPNKAGVANSQELRSLFAISQPEKGKRPDVAYKGKAKAGDKTSLIAILDASEAIAAVHPEEKSVQEAAEALSLDIANNAWPAPNSASNVRTATLTYLGKPLDMTSAGAHKLGPSTTSSPLANSDISKKQTRAWFNESLALQPLAPPWCQTCKTVILSDKDQGRQPGTARYFLSEPDNRTSPRILPKTRKRSSAASLNTTPSSSSTTKELAALYHPLQALAHMGRWRSNGAATSSTNLDRPFVMPNG